MVIGVRVCRVGGPGWGLNGGYCSIRQIVSYYYRNKKGMQLVKEMRIIDSDEIHI